MSYTTAQALLEDLMGSVKNAAALETYLGTASNKGTLDYLFQDEILGEMLFNDEAAFQSVRDSATARGMLINSAAGMEKLTASLGAMVLSGANATFMNEIVLKGRAILAFIKSPYLRPACQAGTGYTNLAAAQALGGSKLKRTWFTATTQGAQQTWTRPTTLLWLFVLALGGGGQVNVAGYLHGAGSGQARGKVFEGATLPVGNQKVIVGTSTSQVNNNEAGRHTIFGFERRMLHNVSVSDYVRGQPAYTNGSYSWLVHALGGAWSNEASATEQSYISGGGVASFNVGMESEMPISRDYNAALFSRMATAPVMDKEFNLYYPSTIGTHWSGVPSPLGPYDAVTATLGGNPVTGDGNSQTAGAGFGFGGGSTTDGIGSASGAGICIVWSIEE